ncbi:MAG: Smr/MutS family protein [Minisyncoccia bacterium]
MSYYADMGKNKYPQEPDIIIDFHGMTTRECKHELDDLMSHKEYAHVRIIVGKGKNSEFGAVLPDFVKNYLSEHAIRFNQSKLRDGGSGSLEVFL